MADGSIRIDVGLDTSKAEKDLTRLKQKITKLENELENDTAKKEGILKNLSEVNAELDAAKERVRYLKEEYKNATGDKKSLLKEELAEAIEEQRLLNSEANKLDTAYDRVKGRIETNTQKLGEMKEQAGAMAQQIEKARPVETLGRSIDNAKTRLSKFIRTALGVGSAIMLFRMLTRSIIGSVKEFAKYDTETRSNLESLKTALAGLRGSWGAAFAPIFNAVVPLLQKLISWLTAAANAVAQFMAVLSGRTTYKKAIGNNNALAGSVANVGEAAEKAEGQLASFDELNVLQDNRTSNSGAGGGGGEAAPYEIVEEDIAPWAQKLAEHLKLIKELAIAIGAAILAWKLVNFLNQLLGLNLTLKQTLGLAIAVGGAVLYIEGWIDAFNNGVDWDNTIAMISGCALAAAGLGLAFGGTAAAIALLVGGIGMLLIGITDWIQKGELSTETFWLLEAAILAVGAAFALLVSPWSLLVAAFVAGGLAIYKNWDSIKDWFNEKVKPWFTVEKWRELGRKAMESIKNGLNSISLPKFHFYWERTGYTGTFFGRTFTVNIPFPHLDWYAKGGVFDGASIIGVGESGQEAVVPLERNTGWINKVVDGVIERLSESSVANALADAFASTPLPAMAGGTVTPPNSATAADALTGINDTLQELRALLAGAGGLASEAGNEYRFYLDGKELHAVIQKYDRQYAFAQGR